MRISSQEITEILQDWSNRDEHALDRLVSVVFEELRSLARQQLARQGQDHTLQPTALVHEAYLRLRESKVEGFESRSQFFALASRLMRGILVDHARQRLTAKRGGETRRISLDGMNLEPTQGSVEPETVLSVHEALTRLEEVDPRQSRVVELRYFGGLTLPETAEALNLSLATIERSWGFARRWLAREIGTSRGR
ncbi:MAG: sigma-70 family RNA polymerase sigma factor [Holophagales bacterium]|nr:sigma-70 family RNA polymerase sigma factor [Holophagales bacterium]